MKPEFQITYSRNKINWRNPRNRHFKRSKQQYQIYTVQTIHKKDKIKEGHKSKHNPKLTTNITKGGSAVLLAPCWL